MPQDQYLLVICTFPNVEEARTMASQLVELREAACVNLIPQAESIYRWEGATARETETVALIKTTTINFRSVEARIQRLHPYETPEIIALPITQGSASYLGWISENTHD